MKQPSTPAFGKAVVKYVIKLLFIIAENGLRAQVWPDRA
jgi:hypothetical protein